MRLTFILLLVVLAGCDNLESQNQAKAIKAIQDYKPKWAKHSLLEVMDVVFTLEDVANIIAIDGWSAEKSSEGVYRVKFRFKRNTVENEVLFAIDIRSGEARALNQTARNYLAIQETEKK